MPPPTIDHGATLLETYDQAVGEVCTSQASTSQVITPYICVHDANAALDWYREFFGAAISNVIPWEGRVGARRGRCGR